MMVKLNVTFPYFFKATQNMEIELDAAMSKNEVVDWVFNNKKDILKQSGCELTDNELASALALGMANVKITKA